MTLSPEARQIRERMDADHEQRRRDIIDGRRPMAQTARTLGSLALVSPGCAVWTDIERKRHGHDESLGGYVLEIIHHRHDNPETGEITQRRAFRCYDPIAPWDQAFRTFDEDLIPQANVEAVDETRLRVAVRRFAARLAAGRGPFTSRDERLAADAHRLIVVTLGGHVS